MNQSIIHSEIGCDSMQASFSAYLDGQLSGFAMQQIAAHLAACPHCDRDFASWRAMQNSLAMLRTDAKAKAPDNLGLKLRIAISHESSRRTSSAFDALSLRWQNSIRPIALQVSAGFAMAVVLLGTLAFLVGSVAVPQAVLANDEPLGAMTAPHYLYSAAHPSPILAEHDATIVVEALINARGRVYDYNIVSGAEDPAVRSQVVNRLLLSVFSPASVFGAPVRGRVVLTFSGVSVHG
jgi:anti-sigma factor RsiW